MLFCYVVGEQPLPWRILNPLGLLCPSSSMAFNSYCHLTAFKIASQINTLPWTAALGFMLAKSFKCHAIFVFKFKHSFKKPLEYNPSDLSHTLAVLFWWDIKSLTESFAISMCGMYSMWGNKETGASVWSNCWKTEQQCLVSYFCLI